MEFEHTLPFLRVTCCQVSNTFFLFVLEFSRKSIAEYFGLFPVQFLRLALRGITVLMSAEKSFLFVALPPREYC